MEETRAPDLQEPRLALQGLEEEIRRISEQIDEVTEEGHWSDEEAPAARGPPTDTRTPHVTDRRDTRTPPEEEMRHLRFERSIEEAQGRSDGPRRETFGHERRRLREALAMASARIQSLKDEITRVRRGSRGRRTTMGSETEEDYGPSSRPKLERPPMFNGEYAEEYNVLNWLAQVERYLTQTKVKLMDWSDYARSYMGKHAQAWMDAEFALTSPPWTTLSPALKDRFLPPDHAIRVEIKFETTVQGEKSLTGYVEAFQKISAALTYAKVVMGEDRKVLQFIRGLNSHGDRRFLLEKSPKTLQEAYKAITILRQAKTLASSYRPMGRRGQGNPRDDPDYEERKLRMLKGKAKEKAWAEGLCLGCGEAGHLVAACPVLNKKLRKLKAMAKWSKKNTSSTTATKGTKKKRFRKLESKSDSEEEESDDDEEDEDEGDGADTEDPEDNEDEENSSPESQG